MNDFLIEEINLSKAIDALIDHVQELTIELGCVLYDVCRYLPEDTALEIRSMKPQDLNCRLLNNEYYQWYVQYAFEGSYDPLLDDELYSEAASMHMYTLTLIMHLMGSGHSGINIRRSMNR